ncbi:WD40 repeat domain-containing protein [Acrocarpospora sp. B8E8]|uniref:WD40 repeat domain-containing protein n=1 Tax=Acrocarpospora sp. B8E8 TaxID=3153572 RepID=UPI00325DCFA5
MIGHAGPISGISAYGDDFIATAGYDNRVILWNQKTGVAMSRVIHDHLANQCTFSPDGRLLVSSSSDYSARLWSVPDLRLMAVLGDHEDDVEMSVFHPTERMVATASRDYRVRVFDYNGELLYCFTGHTADVISVQWNHGGDQVISSSDDGTIKRWSLVSGQLVQDIDLGGVETDTIAIHPNGVIYAGNDDGQLIVLDGESVTKVDAHAAGIKRLAIGIEKNLLVSLSYDRTMRIWDISSGFPRPKVSTNLPAEVWPRSCAFAGDSYIVLGTFGSTYQSYDYQQDRWIGREVAPTYGLNAIYAHESGRIAVGDAGIVWRDNQELSQPGSLCNFFAPIADRLITGGQLGIIFDVLTGLPIHQHRSPLNCGVSFRRDDLDHVIVGTYTGEGLVFCRSNNGIDYVAELKLHDNAVKGVASSGRYIFSVSADGSCTWFDKDDLTLVKTIHRAHDKIANGCVGLGGGEFASISRDLKLRIWSADFTATVIDTPYAHSIKCIAASADARWIATGTYDGHIGIFDRITGTWAALTRPTASGISSLAYDLRHDVFLGSSYDGQAYECAVPVTSG